jgi:hypothetical protein
MSHNYVGSPHWQIHWKHDAFVCLVVVLPMMALFYFVKSSANSREKLLAQHRSAPTELHADTKMDETPYAAAVRKKAQ